MEYTFVNFSRISIHPEVCIGQPHIKSTRITISSILAHLAGGMTMETMLQEFPRLSQADIYEALAFAASSILSKK
jgi:uncharacterized protein (DUF433 family)